MKLARVEAREVLSLKEHEALGGLEDVIEGGLKSFMNVGQALLEIQDRRLYREEFPTFEAYCLGRWGMTGRRARQLSSGAAVVRNLQVSGVRDQESEISGQEAEGRSQGSGVRGQNSEEEELIQKCVGAIVSEQRASVSLLQRRFQIGYGHAVRVMDELEKRGIVGPSKGAEPREIYGPKNGNSPHPGPLSKVEGMPLPTSERQVRPLAQLPAAEQQEIWREEVVKNNGKAPTGKQIEKAVKQKAGVRSGSGNENAGERPEEWPIRMAANDAHVDLLQLKKDIEKNNDLPGAGSKLKRAMGELFDLARDVHSAWRALEERWKAEDYGGGFVIVRLPGKGSIKKKPRFGPGWGGLAKARVFSTKAEAQQRFHGYPGEKIVCLEAAKKLEGAK